MLIGLLIVAASIAAIIGGAVLVNRLTLKGGYDISSSEWRREVIMVKREPAGENTKKEWWGNWIEEWEEEEHFSPLYDAYLVNIWHD